MKNKIITLSTAIVLGTSVFYISCQKKKVNDQLYIESTSTTLLIYKGRDTIYSPKGGSPHGNFKLKFNPAAFASLGSDGKLPVGAEFDDGALIVKEVYDGTELKLYAVMKRDRTSKFASSKWVWAEYKPNGDVVYNVSKEGKGCTGCHSSGSNRDLTRSFDLH